MFPEDPGHSRSEHNPLSIRKKMAPENAGWKCFIEIAELGVATWLPRPIAQSYGKGGLFPFVEKGLTINFE
jgi:hypothetical protein